MRNIFFNSIIILFIYKFKKKSFAWRFTLKILIVSMTINLWALFSFKLKQVNGVQLCDIDTDLIYWTKLNSKRGIS